MTGKTKPELHLQIDIIREAGAWPPCRSLITGAAQETLKHLKYKKPCEISFLLTDDENIRILNRDYRGKDKPTNVLSFPQNEQGMLGDIILSHTTIKKEAADQGKAFKHHLAHLVAHGVLHLMGHDHETSKDARAMEGLEIKILAALGIPDPYC